MSKVTIEYYDESSLTIEEIVARATHTYGRGASVKVESDSGLPHDLIYFALQQIITHEQLSLLYADSTTYHTDVQKLRGSTLSKLTEILDQVLIDNEAKVA